MADPTDVLADILERAAKRLWLQGLELQEQAERVRHGADVKVTELARRIGVKRDRLLRAVRSGEVHGHCRDHTWYAGERSARVWARQLGAPRG